MTNFQILAAQIQTDLKELEKDMKAGMIEEEIAKGLKRISEKIKEWSKEANRIMKEAEAIDSKAEEVMEENTTLEEKAEKLEEL